jgi:2-dehydropantoate 2-reductase
MLNVGINQISAVLHTTYGSFSRLPEARELMRLACREVALLAEREGIALTEADIEDFFPIFARLAPDGKPSMLQDVEAHRKTEVEMFAGTVVAFGRRHGVPTPVNATLLAMIHVIEQSWATNQGRAAPG